FHSASPQWLRRFPPLRTRPADAQSAISMPTSAPPAPARPRPASVHGSRSDHSIASKSHADSHNPHLQIQSPLASLQVQWLLPVLRRTPAGARDETPRKLSHSRKSRRGSSLREPVHARTLRAQTSTRPPPAQSHRDPPKTAATRAPARGSTNPSTFSSAGISSRSREQSAQR